MYIAVTSISKLHQTHIAWLQPDEWNIATNRELSAGSGPTKAHRLHLKHVIRQFRAVEKRLASLMMKNTPEFLELLAEMRIAMKISSEMIPCFSLLLEGPDGKQFPMETVRIHYQQGLRCLLAALVEFRALGSCDVVTANDTLPDL